MKVGVRGQSNYYNKIGLITTSTTSTTTTITRQLSYRKEDRAMRPIYGCPEKFWESSLRTRLLFQKFVMDDTENVCTKFEVRSFTRSWDNRGYSKNLGSPSIRSRSIFSQNFKGLFFGWTLPAKFDVRGFTHSWDNRGYFKNLGSPWIRPRSLYTPKFLKGFCSHGPCEYTCQVWSS